MPNKIRRSLLRQLRKMRFLPSKLYAQYHYEYFSGKKLNLENPREFNAKIEWYKVFYRPKILNTLVDKYEVRSIIENTIGKKYLNEIYGVYDTVEDIPFKDLPNKFVIKATHSSGHNIIVKDKTQLDIKKTSKKLKKWLKVNQYYRMGQEWAYKDVKPRYIIEKFLKEDDKNTLVDYKFYCFNGEPKFIDVHIDREEDHKQGCFDLDFNLLPFGKSKTYKTISAGIAKPTNLKEMVELSVILSKNLPFVRVDFYSVNGKTIFGEMTFYPSDARKEFYPDEYNTIIGDYFELPKLEKGQNVITKF
ncbi:ATP-grasp fold amidoligase family protein [Winogradskyella thalassocola]|uniref:TupA-like ATPgrasp n=1 Tax=Winogradskyella thalassocola TaxID=262004 RepID=A0A1G8EUG5_9FLAO|nr:ATP-grasp fold amidoligase family protein [Winogradskyella thalassocola]SDH73447.1 TupA-like ATPgrasp [Winogradskyella thalassocola]